MQLKRLQLLGFKTFADKTEIEIDRGLTAVVGPNGSGKSNIVDAILWVLGEQNPRMLRGASAQDVIFSGAEKRKPIGMAEVRLTLDNSDRTLPLDFAEVTVTRRVYRSGESQYLLNGAQCRLKDIVELFLDTGLGKGAYAFVSQNEIDAVLSARAEDRRELFEEAAGIKKYRVKKREALRKLEAAEANLTRVRDILHELEGQREPLERAAQEARRYLLLQERLHEIEVGLLVAELQKADYELYGARQERAADQAELLALETRLTTLDREAEEAAEQLAASEQDLDSLRQAERAARSLVERTEGQIALAHSHAANADETRRRIEQELQELAERGASLEASVAETAIALQEADAEEQSRRTVWAEQRSALDVIEASLRQALRQAEERQAARMRAARERSGLEASLAAAEARLADALSRIENLAVEAQALEGAAAEARGRAEEACSAIDSRSAERIALAEERAKLEARKRALQETQAAARADLERLRRRQAEQEARLAALVDLQQSHEGFYQGVRSLLAAVRSGRLAGAYTAVVDLLAVPEPYRVAVEVALGGSLQDVVTESEAEAKAGIEWLKRNHAGRATFLALPLLRPSPRLPADVARGLEGIEGVGCDLVGIAPKYGRVLELLLGRVLIARDIDTALAASRRVQGWSRIVTREGEVLTPGGALSGGSLQGKGGRLVERKGEIDDLRGLVPTTQAALARAAAEDEQAARQLQQWEVLRSELERREALTHASLAAAESELQAAERECARLAKDQQDRSTLRASLTAHVEGLRAEIARLHTGLESGLSDDASADEALAALSAEAATLAAQRDESRASAVAVEVEVGRLAEKRAALARALAADRGTLETLSRQRAARDAELASLQQGAEQAHAARERMAQQLDTAQAELRALEADLALARATRDAHTARAAELSQAARAAADRRNQISQALHTTELRIARLEVQAAQVTDRLREEYSVSREEALARPDDTAIDRNTSMEVGRLRREIRGMGMVNTGAVAEFERLTERYTFLTEQAADLGRSREALLTTIAEIDDSTKGVFMETFEAVRREFGRLFAQLFEGGSAELRLTSPEDVLETGIEVIAEPPGKKPQTLSLLSGGERALTAVALLFAFLVVRPSPFVLLDEVDAPLDGANVERFIRLLHEFSQRSQFLIVTHNATTMEASPTWYGVTMREPGVSSILSYRVPVE